MKPNKNKHPFFTRIPFKLQTGRPKRIDYFFIPSNVTKTHDALFTNKTTLSDHNMIQMSLPRKNIKRNLNIKVDPYIFPDSVIETPFIKTIEKIISDNLDKLDTPTIDDYYKTTDILMDKTKHHMKLTTYKERAIIEDL